MTLFARSPSRLALRSQADLPETQVLAALRYSSARSGNAPSALPHACPSIATPLLGRSTPAPAPAPVLWHVLTSNQPVHCAEAGAIRYRDEGDFIFGVVTLPQAVSLEQQAHRAYRDIFDFLHAHGNFRLWRAWNYLPRINADENGLERYRHFNTGRRQAFTEELAPRAGTDQGAHEDAIHFGQISAACGIGTVGAGADEAGLCIAFLASRLPFLQIENPRQVSAYQYPPDYGPSSPVFARAIVGLSEDATGARSRQFFLSGTASILGHRTCHAGDVAEQCRETLRNIEAVLTEANRQLAPTALPPLTLAGLDYLVYLRHPEDLTKIQPLLEQALDNAHIHYVHADICRNDLLVEIEATALDTF